MRTQVTSTPKDSRERAADAAEDPVVRVAAEVLQPASEVMARPVPWRCRAADPRVVRLPSRPGGCPASCCRARPRQGGVGRPPSSSGRVPGSGASAMPPWSPRSPRRGLSGTSLRARGPGSGSDQGDTGFSQVGVARSRWCHGHHRTTENNATPDSAQILPDGHGRPRLHRACSGRMLAGVAAGLADYFDVDPTIVRIGFVALAFVGGLAVPLYLAGWLLIPDEDTDVSVAEELLGPRSGPAAPTEPTPPRPTDHRPPPTTEHQAHEGADPMRYRWDPAYPMGRRDTQPPTPTCARPTTSATPWPTSSRATTPRAGSTRPSSRPPRHRHVGHDAGRPQRAVPRPARGSQRATAPAAAAPAHPALGLPGRLPRHRGRRHHPLLPALPRAVAPLRHRRLRACGGTPTGTTITTSSTTAAAAPSSVDGPLSRATHTPPRSTDDDAHLAACRCMELFAGLPDGARRVRGVLRRRHGPPGQVVQAQDVPVRLWHLSSTRPRRRPARRHSHRAAGQGDSWSEHSLLNQLRSPIAVVALSPLTMLTLSEREFFAIPEHHPVLAGRLVARSASSADRLALPVFNALAHVLSGRG